jgi:hypothetical protein
MNTEFLEIIKSNPFIQRWIDCTHEFREQARNHRLFARLDSLERVRIFMEHHVWSVWDFMSLGKALQRELTCVDIPWVPNGEPLSRRLINEIVLEEESDEDGEGGYKSHFELYLEAMDEAGADRSAIDGFTAALREKTPLREALAADGIPEPARRFVESTFSVIDRRRVHEISSAFTLGREEIIPDMFYEVVWKVRDRFPDRLGKLVFYLERHINVDSDRHVPLSMRMNEHLCGRDESRWEEAIAAARTAVKARIDFWTGIEKAIRAEQAREPVG